MDGDVEEVSLVVGVAGDAVVPASNDADGGQVSSRGLVQVESSVQVVADVVSCWEELVCLLLMWH